MKKQSSKRIPPDGGWGWMVCLGSSFISLSLRSSDPSFGLLFGDLLKELKVDTTGAAVIMNTLDSMMNFSGMFVGPLIKKFTYRKVAIWGSLLSCTGLILTSQANSFTYIICTYSILGGIGTGLAMAAAFVALNSYFKEKRTQLVGLSMAGTSLGMMCMPQIVHLLLSQYDFRGTVLILSGLALHAVVGSCLFQPVEWHLIPAPCEKELKSMSNGNVAEKDGLLNVKQDELKRINAEISDKDQTQALSDCNENRNKSGKLRGDKWLLKKIVGYFDLNLLKDPIYLNIIIGLGLFYVAELNFKMITPFFLESIGMTKPEIALCLSLTAFADVVARLTAPTICAKMKFQNRKVLWISTIFVGISRSTTAELMPGKMLMAALIINGFLRGVTLTNFNLSVAEHCTLDMLPSALGIMMVSKGLFVAILGPIIGLVRDISGSYRVCIHTMTGSILLCFMTWGIEFAVKEIRMRRNVARQRKVCRVA